MKTCPECLLEKDDLEFGKNVAREDGISYYCLKCTRAKAKKKPDGWKRKTEDMRAYQKAWRLANREKCRGYEKTRKGRTSEQEREKYYREQRKIHGPDWKPRVPVSKTMSEEEYRKYRNKRASEARRVRRQTDPVAKKKHLARKNLQMAVKRGKVIPLPCFMCGEKAEAHHPDYDRPRDVVWLCSVHHAEVHSERRF